MSGLLRLFSDKAFSQLSYRLVSYSTQCTPELRRRFMIFGLMPNARLKVLRQAPFHGPWELSVGHQLLALRQEELNLLVLEQL